MRPKRAMASAMRRLAFGGLGEVGGDEVEVFGCEVRMLGEEGGLGLLEFVAVASGRGRGGRALRPAGEAGGDGEAEAAGASGDERRRRRRGLGLAAQGCGWRGR